MKTRAPRLRRRRDGDAPKARKSRARTITIADAMRGSHGGLSPEELVSELGLDEVAAELRIPRRRHEATLSEVADELREPRRRHESTLAEVAAKLRVPKRRRAASLAEVAAKLRAPASAANDERAITGGGTDRDITHGDHGGGVLDFVMPARPIAIELVGGRGHYERVIAAVTNAHTSVWIATANAKELMVEDARAKPGRRRSMRGRASYVSILSLLDELASRGVELRLLHAEIPSGPFRAAIARHPQLVAGGLALRRCPRVHMKAVIVDGELLYLGSANWTGAGLGAKGSGRRNFELGFVTTDAQLLDQVQGIYERVWSGGECEGCKLRGECPGPLAELDTPTQIRRTNRTKPS